MDPAAPRGPRCPREQARNGSGTAAAEHRRGRESLPELGPPPLPAERGVSAGERCAASAPRTAPALPPRPGPAGNLGCSAGGHGRRKVGLCLEVLTSVCLFIRSRCLPSLADGLFGQCQVGSVQDRPYFQVTSPVLQRLQDVLRHLMAQGLSWQDGITQYVISQEMERIPRLRLPPSLEPVPPSAQTGTLFSSQAPTLVPILYPQPRVPHGSHFPSFLGLCPWAKHTLNPTCSICFIPGPWSPCRCRASNLMLHPFADAALKRLASLLASYGLGLPELSPQQISSLSTLLQLLQSSGELGAGMGQAGTASSRCCRALFQGRECCLLGWVLPLGLAAGVQLLELLAKHLHLSTASFINISVVGPALTFRIRQNPQNFSLADVASQTGELSVKGELEHELGLKIVQTGVGERNEAAAYSRPSRFGYGFHSVLLTFITLACMAVIAIAVSAAFCLRRHAKQREKERLAALGPEGAADTTFEYQELCRQHMAAKSLFGRTEAPAAPAETSRVSSVSSQFSDAPQPSPSSHSSTPSWCEEPVQSNMDISTGHMILAYMEDHLRNRDRLAKEWQALCAYQAEPSVCSIAQSEANLKKNRNPDYVPYDHVRIKLKAESNPSRSDFINASPIIEHDPRMPAYIATQGPLSHTIADFWQMVWEHGCTVIVMLSPLAEDSVKQCDRYWPDEGSSLYHIYEVNLVSEHIWCEDFLVRSFYLKNVQSQETRTLTQFHFLSWPAEGIPTTTRPLLDFRRKVNKCYRGRSCPIIVHCSDGAGRTGTYILVDMVLNRMAKGVKEIDIAATLEHIRDQRPGMVQTKDQFEFALTAVAEEVNAILKALPQ
uniref:Protein tyrosine phosphatase receptor type N n=1 Tax=Catharus ustulatus TaxID=91951 RepID=A0A8C3TLX2_CATUS